ncbi:hypothetical protein [Bacillus sp. PS06]|uniref:hypothetical protein n=1 Tax=Bacillus sp. PS06 TaxID=2764176 RepID=UPI001785ED73|nr:hypothetical protein [Bacillus sp. PS06]MBD8067488.1 hypothetical protein [Bacillus sp. PS06]
MKRLNKEVELFFNNYYKDHDQLQLEIEKWIDGTDKGLDDLSNKAASFESDFEERFEKVNHWLRKKQFEMENRFEPK